jgi:hypothetical protein
VKHNLPGGTMIVQGRNENVCSPKILKRAAGITLWQWISTQGFYAIGILIALCCAFVQPQLHAQATSGTILGRIQDQSGAVIPDATVTITNAGTAESKTAKSDALGNYEILYLIPGAYRVSAAKEGFSVAARTAFDLHVDQTVRVDLTLKLGAANETITVTAEEPQLKTQTTDIGEVIESEQIATLPLNVRNFAQFMDLTTGTSPNYSAQGGTVSADHPEGISATNVNGLPSDGNNWQLDGVSNNEGFFSVLTVNPSVDAIQEFKAITSNYSAEFGRAGGANVQISIKSGTNKFHGVAFEFLRNSAFDANDYFSDQNNSPIPPFKQNQFGANIGGPIRKDKIFFFGDYEGFRSSLGATETMTVPTPLQRQGIFTETDPITGLNQPTIYDPITKIAEPNNTLPRIDSVAANIIALLPQPNIPGPGGAELLSNNYFGKDTTTHNVDQGDGRVDYRISDKNQAFARYSVLDTTLQQPPFLGKVVGGDPFLAAISTSFNQNLAISDVHTFSPKLLNEFRFGFNKVHLNWAAYDVNSDESATVGIPGVNDFCAFCGGLAHIAITGMSDFGHTPYAPTYRHDSVLEWIDNVTMVQGRNTLKLGIDFSNIHASLFQTSNPVGEFDFNSNMTSDGTGSATAGGIGIASFLTGNAVTVSRDSMSGYPHYLTKQFFSFVQDDFRITPKLTLNLGARYEIYTAAKELHNDQANFDLMTGNLLDACIATTCSGGVKTSYGNAEPRIGFAYTVDPKTVIRSGFGVSAFPPGSGGQIGTLAENEPWETGQQNNSPTPSTPGPTLAEGIPAVPPLQARPGAGPGTYIATGSHIFYLDSNLRQTKAFQWNLDVERTLLPNLLFDVAYVGNSAVGIFLNIPGNYAELDPNSTLSIQERRPYYATNPDLQQFTKRENVGHSDYHSLQAKLDKKFSHGLTFLAAYTWSKNLQRGVDFVNPDNYMQKDLSEQDLKQRFVLSYTYELPIGRGKLIGKDMNGALNAAVGGWQIQGITVLRTGFPFTVTLANSTLDNGLGNQPNRNGSAGKLSNPSVKEWFDWTAFSNPGDQYGNSGYDILRGPGGKNNDMSLFKNINFTGSRYVQFRAEFFNVFNNVEFGNPNASYCGGTCGEGTITSLAAGYNPREMQFAVKLYF